MQIFEKKVTAYSPWITKKIVAVNKSDWRTEFKNYFIVVLCFSPIIVLNWFVFCAPDPVELEPARKERVIIGDPGDVFK